MSKADAVSVYDAAGNKVGERVNDVWLAPSFLKSETQHCREVFKS